MGLINQPVCVVREVQGLFLKNVEVLTRTYLVHSILKRGPSPLHPRVIPVICIDHAWNPGAFRVFAFFLGGTGGLEAEVLTLDRLC